MQAATPFLAQARTPAIFPAARRPRNKPRHPRKGAAAQPPAPAQSLLAHPPPRSRPHMKTRADFAIGLIAAKPVKPCDGGVFGALNSLSKTE